VREAGVNLDLGPIVRSITRQRGAFALVVLEIASGFAIIACILMASAWYLHIGHTASGHREDDLVDVAIVSAATSSEPELARTGAIERGQIDTATIQRTPGVLAVAPLSASLIDEHWSFPTRFSTPGKPRGPSAVLGFDDREAFGWSIYTSPAAGEVLGLHPLEGGMPEGPAAGDAVVITRCLRDELFPRTPFVVGLTLHDEGAAPARIAGVVEDVVMRIPFLQHARCAAFRFAHVPDDREAHYLVRTQAGQRAAVVAALTESLGPSGPDRLVKVRGFSARAGRAHSISSGIVVILSIMAVTVGVVALLGALAVSSFLVAERTRQIGIRRALGATRQDVMRYFLVENALAVAAGTVLGIIATLVLYLMMKRLFHGLVLDWRHLAITGVLLWVDATLAALVPARRAADIPPHVASRGS
jgi:putative ABC transport system permease protein